ncbi:MAG: DUF1573 domain-containing protein [Elusimicrobia bacterium]|nr:DUF1573 domain-containing protein [Elusimicrobiota bacterium]
MKHVTTLPTIIFISILCVIARSPEATAAISSPSIGLSDAYWEFQRVKEGTLLKKILTITNTGTETLKLKIRSSCECVTTDVSGLAVHPGGKKNVRINFDTAGYSGKKRYYIFMDTNDPRNGQVTWLIEGEIAGRKSGEGIAQPAEIRTHPPVRAGEVQDAGQKAPRGLIIEMFHTPNCRYCIELKETTVPRLSRKYNKAIIIKSYLLNDPENYEKFLLVEKELRDENNKLPAVVIGGKILGGSSEIRRQLEEEIIRAVGMMQDERRSPETGERLTMADIKKRVDSLGILPVMVAGLVDGLNPCAFAGIVFLIAYLSMIQKRRTVEVFWTGIMFIIGTFVVYFLIGLGLSKVLATIGQASAVSKIIYGVVGVITLVLSYYSFSDYFAVRAIEQGKQAKVVLQLPNYFRWKIYALVEKYGKLKYIMPFGFILGAAISLLEFFCTGQIYLPTIMYMVSVGHFRTKAVFYLGLYCLMFVLPLMFIFMSMLFGLKSEKIEMFGRRHIAAVKFATGLIFLILSVLVIFITLS